MIDEATFINAPNLIQINSALEDYNSDRIAEGKKPRLIRQENCLYKRAFACLCIGTFQHPCQYPLYNLRVAANRFFVDQRHVDIGW